MAVFSLSSALTAAPFYNRKFLALKDIKLLLLYLGIFVQRLICHEYPQNAVRLGGDVQLCRILICLCLEAYKVVRILLHLRKPIYDELVILLGSKSHVRKLLTEKIRRVAALYHKACGKVPLCVKGSVPEKVGIFLAVGDYGSVGQYKQLS